MIKYITFLKNNSEILEYYFMYLLIEHNEKDKNPMCNNSFFLFFFWCPCMQIGKQAKKKNRRDQSCTKWQRKRDIDLYLVGRHSFDRLSQLSINRKPIKYRF